MNFNEETIADTVFFMRLLSLIFHFMNALTSIVASRKAEIFSTEKYCLK